MRIYLLLFAFVISNMCLAQFRTSNAPGNLEQPFSGFTRIDYARIIVPKKKNNIEGSVYAFKKWSNRGVLQLGDKSYTINSINFNMFNNTIEAKVSQDSVYVFDLKNVDHAYINNRKYKSYYDNKDGKNRIFEVISGNDTFELLKGFEVGIHRYDTDPLMVKKKDGKYFTTKTYYVKRDSNISEVSLKKKTLLAVFGDKADDVKVFAKENKLSFKKENDLKKIIDYYNSL